MPVFNWPIIGHQPIIDYLQAVIENNRLNHAYLFHGPQGLGKSLVADYFIKTIFCLAKGSLPCDGCLHCRQIKNRIHPDIIYLSQNEDKKNITVEQVRETRAKIHRGTFLDSYKVILISNANTLSLSASNALLKILEEPTKRTIFIFLTPNLKNIPATILSRVQIIKFLPVPFEELKEYLVNKGFEKEQAYELSHLSAGFPGRILSFVNHPKLLQEYKDNFKQYLNNISGDLSQRFDLVEKLSAQSKSESAKLNSKQFLENLSSLLRDAMLLKNICFDKITHIYLKHQLSILASKYSSAKFVSLLNKIKTTKRLIDQNVNLRLALENLMLEF